MCVPLVIWNWRRIMCGKWTVIPYQAGDHSWEIFKGIRPESIEWFVEDQAFSIWLVPRPSPSVSSTGDTQEDRERETLTDGRGDEVGAKSLRWWESLVLYSHSILSESEDSAAFSCIFWPDEKVETPLLAYASLLMKNRSQLVCTNICTLYSVYVEYI